MWAKKQSLGHYLSYADKNMNRQEHACNHTDTFNKYKLSPPHILKKYGQETHTKALSHI